MDVINKRLMFDLRIILLDFPKAKILSKSVRSMEEQMGYVVKRWNGYPSTRAGFMKKFQLKENQLPKDLASLTDDQENHLKSRIQHHSDAGNGFRHLKGNAIDISVRKIEDWRRKQLLKQRIEYLGYNIILEKPPKYYVPLQEATTFHVEIKKK